MNKRNMKFFSIDKKFWMTEIFYPSQRTSPFDASGFYNPYQLHRVHQEEGGGSRGNEEVKDCSELEHEGSAQKTSAVNL